MTAHLFVIRNRTDGLPPASSMKREAAPFCRPIPFRVSDEDYGIPVVQLQPPKAERLLAAHRIAAEVRKRHPQMQIRRCNGIEWTAA